MSTPKLSVIDLAARIVADDPELRDSLRELMNDAIVHMQYTLKHGSMAEKNLLAKVIMPTLIKALGETNSGEAAQREREAYQRMMDGFKTGGLSSTQSSTSNQETE